MLFRYGLKIFVKAYFTAETIEEMVRQADWIDIYREKGSAVIRDIHSPISNHYVFIHYVSISENI